MRWEFDLSNNVASMQGDGFHWIEYTYTGMDKVSKRWDVFAIQYTYCEYRYLFRIQDAAGAHAEVEVRMDSGIEGAK